MAKYAISQEGLDSLDKLSAGLMQVVTGIDDACKTLYTKIERLESGLGVYEKDILLTSVLHDVCGLFFYIKHNNPALFAEQLRKVAHPKNICILHDRHKVYCLPSMLNKGNAIERFAKKFGEAISIAAGDSEFDIPMLARADTRIIPPVLEQYLPTENTITISTSVFSDGICNYLSTIAKRGTHKHE